MVTLDLFTFWLSLLSLFLNKSNNFTDLSKFISLPSARVKADVQFPGALATAVPLGSQYSFSDGANAWLDQDAIHWAETFHMQLQSINNNV